MDISTIIGLGLAFFSIGFGMYLKGASPSVLINPAAFLIIMGGTAAALFNAFPLAQIKQFPALFKIALLGKKLMDKPNMVVKFLELALISRREGLLSLESKLEEIDDEFLRKGLTLVIDGSAPDIVEGIMNEEIHWLEERHRSGALIFSQAGTYAPTLGVLGAVVGLIAALGNLNDIEKLGHSIAAAFVATLLGIFTGYVLWHPISNKLKQISKEEVELKEMIVEGVLCIQRGISPTFIEQTMLARLSPNERKQYETLKGHDSDG